MQRDMAFVRASQTVSSAQKTSFPPIFRIFVKIYKYTPEIEVKQIIIRKIIKIIKKIERKL